MKITYSVVKATSERMVDSHRFMSRIGTISLIMPIEWNGNTFEIYCIKGGLFEDVERFVCLDSAMSRITYLLCPTTQS